MYIKEVLIIASPVRMCVCVRRYQHSRHLVNALNRFANQEADLPEGWEKKLNQQGKVRLYRINSVRT